MHAFQKLKQMNVVGLVYYLAFSERYRDPSYGSRGACMYEEKQFV